MDHLFLFVVFSHDRQPRSRPAASTSRTAVFSPGPGGTVSPVLRPVLAVATLVATTPVCIASLLRALVSGGTKG